MTMGAEQMALDSLIAELGLESGLDHGSGTLSHCAALQRGVSSELQDLQGDLHTINGKMSQADRQVNALLERIQRDLGIHACSLDTVSVDDKQCRSRSPPRCTLSVSQVLREADEVLSTRS